MDRQQRSNMRRAFKQDELLLLGILNDWDPMRASPPHDEYDCLTHHVLSALHREPSVENVQKVITHELEAHFGLGTPGPAIHRVAQRIVAWWRTRGDASNEAL